jgi:hypothetical protein
MLGASKYYCSYQCSLPHPPQFCSFFHQKNGENSGIFFSSVNSSNFDKCFGKICKTSDIKKNEKTKENESLTIYYHFNFGH